jgi:hypothetical protein
MAISLWCKPSHFFTELNWIGGLLFSIKDGSEGFWIEESLHGFHNMNNLWGINNRCAALVGWRQGTRRHTLPQERRHSASYTTPAAAPLPLPPACARRPALTPLPYFSFSISLCAHNSPSPFPSHRQRRRRCKKEAAATSRWHVAVVLALRDQEAAG